MAARVRQPVTVGWHQRLCGRTEASAALDAGAQCGIVAGTLAHDQRVRVKPRHAFLAHRHFWRTRWSIRNPSIRI